MICPIFADEYFEDDIYGWSLGNFCAGPPTKYQEAQVHVICCRSDPVTVSAQVLFSEIKYIINRTATIAVIGR